MGTYISSNQTLQNYIHSTAKYFKYLKKSSHDLSLKEATENNKIKDRPMRREAWGSVPLLVAVIGKKYDWKSKTNLGRKSQNLNPWSYRGFIFRFTMSTNSKLVVLTVGNDAVSSHEIMSLYGYI